MYSIMCIFKKALSPLADLEALHKQDVRIKAELSTTWLTIGGVPQNTWCPSKDWEIYQFQAYKEFSVQSLANRQVETSVATYYKEYKLHRISLGKSLNKEKQQDLATITKPLKQVGPISTVATFYYFKR